MAASNEPDVATKLTALQLKFKQQLPGKVAEIERMWEAVSSTTMGDAGLTDLHRSAHSLSGSGGTFGATAVSGLVSKIEKIIKSLLNKQDQRPSISSEVRQQVETLLGQLVQAAEQWQPSDIPYLEPSEPKEQRDGKLIYLTEDDELFAENLIARLEQAGYLARHFTKLSDFEAACEKETPSVIIMDMVFSDGDIAGADVIRKLKAKNESFPPVIFISVRDDIEARLVAARAGARRYFCKPLDVKKIISTLDGLTAKSKTKPYKVLLIDDDEILLDYYAMVLLNAGMEIKAISKPLEGLAALYEFQPDIVILDFYMPECSGPELAQVIRQDDTYAQMPIIFLSTETDIGRQLTARNLGGDDFLVNPIEAEHLVSAATAKAQRSRWIHRLNKDLESALKESEYQVITSDRHNIVSTADVAGNITHANNKFCEVSGYSREELLGKNHRILKSGHHSTEFYKKLWDAISQGKVWNGTICNLNKNGAEYWVDSTIVPFLDDKGKPYKYVSVRTDVSALRQSEERLNYSQEFSRLGAWDWNINTGSLYWSDRIWKLFGYNKEDTETTYDNFLAAVHPDDRQEVINAVNNCIEKGAEYNIEHRVVWQDGSIHWVLERGNVTRTEDDVPLHMLGAVEDIDIRKNAELVLADSERQLLEAQSLSNIGSWQANLVTGELTWSDEIYRIFGFEPGSFAPSVEAFHAAVHPDDLEKVHESEKRAEQTGHHNVEHRIVQPDGTIRHVHELAKVETDSKGNLLKMTGTVQDITERVEVELRQRSNNNILELVAMGKPLDDILEAVVLNTEMLLNNAICSILLLDSTGKFLSHCIAPNLPDSYNEAIAGLEIGMEAGSCGEAAYSGKRVIASDIHTHPNWTTFLELANKAGLRACWSEPFFSTSGDVLGTFAIYYPTPKNPDHSDLKIMMEFAQFAAIAVERNLSQKALINTKEEAENANRAKSQFLSSMSHELRTPMNAIMGFGQLLKMDSEQPLAESQQENVDEIVKASHHLLALINEVLDLAKIEAGRIDLSIEAVMVSEVIAESLQLINPLARKRGIEVKLIHNDAAVSYDELLQQHTAVRADRTRLKQVFLNLLSNAVKYNSDNGTLTINCNSSDQIHTRISITDTGAGLTPEQITHLFKAFSRLGAEQSDIEGTGIGLVITKNIVELMGGNIGVESQLGVGSTFWVELPSDVLQNAQLPEHTADTNNEVDMKPEAVANPGHEHTVLYIEDNPANLRLVTQLLGRRPNIHMWSAPEPLLGLELAAEHKPDLILLDINLPGMSGFEVLEHLRQREATRNTIVIAISANAMPKDVEKGIEAGFDDYITKPIDVQALLKAVDVALLESTH